MNQEKGDSKSRLFLDFCVQNGYNENYMDGEKSKFNLPEIEEKILKFWEERKIFEKTLQKTKKDKPFVFYEGPPTANAAPGIHHIEARAFKDIIPRYKTMRGFFVSRKAGWDTHGLPVEIQVEKELGFKTKQDIEKYGIAAFNRKAQASVWRYKEEWERLTRRIGFWLDLENPYITYDPRYMETLWWIIKEIWKQGLLEEDFKVLPWCPRCQTGLSTHELGQPGAYQTVKENSVFVKLKIQGRAHEYLLIWTTTPWTLPANVAVAVNPKIEYTKYKFKIQSSKSKTITQNSEEKAPEDNKNEYLWSAVTPPYDTGEEIEIVEKVSGKLLLGLHYEPLFQIPAEYSLGTEPTYRIIPAEFVAIDEGTGMVHLAPAFGDEDMNALKAQNSKLKVQNYETKNKLSYPILHTVNPDGTMKAGIIGAGKWIKDADKDIITDLKRRGLLYRVVPYEHDYPHCWRCATPLLYFAKNSWWVRTTEVKKKILENNEKIHWIPDHLKHGRFGEFLEELRDWAFSRERFWGTPLPIWKCVTCNKLEVVGSRDELANHQTPARNRYILMRHGEALGNVKDVISYAPDGQLHLTMRGRIQVERQTVKLGKEKIDHIIASDILRTKETAEIVAQTLGIKVFFDKRLREINTGDFEGKHSREYHAFFSSPLEKFSKHPPGGGETLGEVRHRMLSCIADIEKKQSGKTILVISHEYPLWMLWSGALGLSNEEALEAHEKRGEEFIRFAQTAELRYRFVPRDETGEINFHRPYVDALVFSCRVCKGIMRRVPDVADVWFDSGAMPFAQAHYPFEKKKSFAFPADYISEAVDQTRGWFYTLLAVGTLLGNGPAYKNVISLGHVLDKNGQKMSKSKGNVVDPWLMIQKYGADTLRWYFYTINSPGEPKRFDEKDVFNKLRGFIMTWWNCFALFDTYIDKIQFQTINNQQSKIKKGLNVLDEWILLKKNRLVEEITEKLDRYEVTAAARLVEDFVINDFSQWYLRRSRRRFQQPVSKEEKEAAAATTADILLTLCRVSAPFVPLVSEAIFQKLKKKMKLKEESVHVMEWPLPSKKQTGKDKMLLEEMDAVREIAAQALKLRAEAHIKVRQPLARLQIKNRELEKSLGLLELLKDEINVKEIIFGDTIKLDNAITPELKEEGLIREIVRTLQEMRKDAGLKPRAIITCQFSGAPNVEGLIEKWKVLVKKEVNARKLKMGGKKEFKVEREIELDGQNIWIGIS